MGFKPQREAFIAAIEAGNMEMINFIDKNYTPDRMDFVSVNMSKVTDIAVAKWIIEQKNYGILTTFDHDISSLNVLSSLFEEGKAEPRAALIHAAGSGNYEAFRAIYQSNFPKDPDIFIAAIRSGNLELVKYLHEQEFEYQRERMENERIPPKGELLVWLEEEGYPKSHGTFYAAAEEGNLDMIKWLYARNWPGEKSALTLMAAKSGNIAVIKWFYDHGFECLVTDIYGSVISRKKEMLKYVAGTYLRQNNKEHLSEEEIAHEHELKMEHGPRSTIEQSILTAALCTNNIEIVDFLYKLCKFETLSGSRVPRSVNIETLNWLDDKKIEIDDLYAGDLDPEIEGVTLPPVGKYGNRENIWVLDEPISREDFGVVEWFFKKGYHPNMDDIKNAFATYNIKLIRMVLEAFVDM
jgi:hypothetical protein